MSVQTVRGMLLSMLIGAAMVAGVLLASNAKATPDQDYEYFALLQNEGMQITSPSKAKAVAYAVCNELRAGNNWRLIITELMNGGDWDFDTAATVFSVAVVVYCPSLTPAELDSSGSKVA